MISRTESIMQKNVWAELPVRIQLTSPASLAQHAESARAHLDREVPGDWDFTVEVIVDPGDLSNGTPRAYTCKGRMQILGVIREACSSPNRDARSAADEAFLLTAARFGIFIGSPNGVMYEPGAQPTSVDG